MASKFGENFLHGFQVGRKKVESEEEAERQAEDRKFQRENHKLAMQRLKIQDMEAARKSSFDEAEVFAKVNQDPGEVAVPEGGYGQPATKIPYQGLKATMAQQIQQKQREKMRTVDPAAGAALGLPAGDYDSDVLKEVGDTQRTKETRTSMEKEGNLNRQNQINVARIHAQNRGNSGGVGAGGDMDANELETWGQRLNSGQISVSQVPVGKNGKFRDGVMQHMQKRGLGIMTPDIKSKLDEFNKAKGSVGKIEETFQKLKAADGIAKKAGMTAQLNAEIKGLSRMIGRSMGEKGVFTDADKTDFADLIAVGGGGWMTPIAANFAPDMMEARINNVKRIIERVQGEEFRGFEERLGGQTLPGVSAPKKKRRYDSKTDSFVDIEE